LTNVCHSEYLKCPPVAGMQAWDICAAGQWHGNNAMFHYSPHINQAQHQIIDILHFCLIDAILYSVGLRSWTFDWHISVYRDGMIMISKITPLMEWMQEMMHILHSVWQWSQPEKNISKQILWYHNVYMVTNSVQASEEITNLVYKLMTDKL